MPVSTNDFANKLWKVADFYDEFGLSPKIAALLYDASNIVRSFSGIVDKNDELKADNSKLRELVRLLLWGVDNDMPRDEELVWSQKVDALTHDLGVEQ